MSIYVTGDTHGGEANGFKKFSSKNFPEGKSLTSEDYVIICGDFGLIWHNIPTGEEIWWTKWLSNKPWTTLFLDGNHENHELLQFLPREKKFGGTVGRYTGKIFHLRRGEIYTIEDKKFFCLGGADSIDKSGRKEGVKWWPGEVPSSIEFNYALDNLEKHQYNVDYIIAHTLPLVIVEILGAKFGYDISRAYQDPVSRYMNNVIQNVQFKGYYSGHWHKEWDFGKYRTMYRRILEVPK